MYDGNSNVLSVLRTDKSDAGAPDQTFTTALTYDGLDRLSSETDNSGNTRQFFYDYGNNLARMRSPHGHDTRWVYDGVGRAARTIRDLRKNETDAAPSNGDAKIVIAMTWDDSNRVASQTDDNGNTTRCFYDPLNRLTAEIYADGTQSASTFDVHGNALSIKDPNGSTVLCRYDLFDRCIERQVSCA